MVKYAKPVRRENGCWLTRGPPLPKGSNRGGKVLPALTAHIRTLLEAVPATGRRQMGICSRSSSQPSIPPQNPSHIQFNPVTCHLFWRFAREVRPWGPGQTARNKTKSSTQQLHAPQFPFSASFYPDDLITAFATHQLYSAHSLPSHPPSSSPVSFLLQGRCEGFYFLTRTNSKLATCSSYLATK